MTTALPPRTINHGYPGLPSAGPYDLFGPDTVNNLRRRLMETAAAPKDRRLHVSHAEIRRVLALHPDVPLPQDISDRLTAPEPKRLAGRPGLPPYRACVEPVLEEITSERYQTLLRRLNALRRGGRLQRWRDQRRFAAHLTTPSLLAAEIAKQRFFGFLNAPRMRNRFSEMKKQGRAEFP